MLQEVFGKVLEMSLIGSYCILFVLPVRFVLLRCGRKYACYLWLAVFLKLLIPFSIQGSFSLIPRQVMEFSVMAEGELPLGDGAVFGLESGGLSGKKEIIPAVNEKEEGNVGSLKDQGGSSFSENEAKRAAMGRLRRKLSSISQIVWLLGISGILLCNLVHALLLKREIAPDRWARFDEKERIAEIEGLSSPFLWGICRPVIFLPAGLCGEERKYIVAHENCHRRRGDSIVKIVVFAIAAVHWFNPAVWAAWIFFCRDLEVSCDEAVLAGAGKDIKKQYAQSLLTYAAVQNGYLMTPLTFGEPSVRTRIKNVLHFRKRSAVLTGAAWIAAAAVAAGFAVQPAKTLDKPKDMIEDDYSSLKETQAYSDTAEKEDGGVQDSEEIWTENFEHLTEEIPTEPESGGDGGSAAYQPPHREGYQGASVEHITRENWIYFTPGLRDEEELDKLAQKALRELYDLTGYQIEECVYECNDLGSFFFAKTQNCLDQSLIFYDRSFGEQEGYGMIPSMYIVNARRVWYSDVQQLDIPFKIEQMSKEELAVWFLKRCAVYQGEEIASAEWQDDHVKVTTGTGTFYEVWLDMPIWAVSHIYGPYPKDYSP